MNTKMKVERTSSIEKEPQTLSLDQLQCAREAALCVLNANTVEEAMSIFTEGLKPVLSINGKMDMNDAGPEIGDFRDIVSAPF